MRRAVLAACASALCGAAAQCTAGSGPCDGGACPYGPPPDGKCPDGSIPAGGGGGPGGDGCSGARGPSTTDSTSCTGAADCTDCSLDGSGNFYLWRGSYSSATGKFSGDLITNGCSQNKYGYCPLCNNGAGMQVDIQHTAKCQQHTFPMTGYESGPKAAPLRGMVGLSLAGVAIYGPMEAGFGTGNAPNPCTNGQTGVCFGGLDVPTCEAKVEHDCGSANVNYGLMLDTCGGHALPYHYHNDLFCDYDHTINGHSPLIGIAMDGYGIYGLYEGVSKAKPTGLDACNGHTGPVPAKSGGDGVVTSTAGTVYHYHVTSTAPYTLGCFGPVSSVDQCKSLYTTTCNLGFETLTTGKGTFCYDLDCPCYETSGMNAAASSCGITTTSPPAPAGTVTTTPPTRHPTDLVLAPPTGYPEGTTPHPTTIVVGSTPPPTAGGFLQPVTSAAARAALLAMPTVNLGGGVTATVDTATASASGDTVAVSVGFTVPWATVQENLASMEQSLKRACAIALGVTESRIINFRLSQSTAAARVRALAAGGTQADFSVCNSGSMCSGISGGPPAVAAALGAAAACAAAAAAAAL